MVWRCEFKLGELVCQATQHGDRWGRVFVIVRSVIEDKWTLHCRQYPNGGEIFKCDSVCARKVSRMPPDIPPDDVLTAHMVWVLSGEPS